eukprot:CAMPEP_0177776270 /NCGR_PEP_ID=MMETSP0491_2-20121128/14618_1 /TAXON_ID=63592 /ORGANISM="Tetraselmis chuii, Strain PLY429" /LENGTH=43 /DNA_ID= /DNA_START= /DNA_END= /DNA_ORIENTATION=
MVELNSEVSGERLPQPHLAYNAPTDHDEATRQQQQQICVTNKA